MRMMKMGGGQQLARSMYPLRWFSGSIHLEMDRWNFSQHPIFLFSSGSSSSLLIGLPSRSKGNGSCCSRSMSSITAAVLHSRLHIEIVCDNMHLFTVRFCYTVYTIFQYLWVYCKYISRLAFRQMCIFIWFMLQFDKVFYLSGISFA